MGNELHGINGLIYISGTELAGANSWSLTIDKDTIQPIKFGTTWKQTIEGAKGWSGSINAYEQGDSKLIIDATTASGVVSLLIYPDRNNLSNYYSGNAIFGANTDGNTNSAVNKNGTFTGDDTLTITGFS